MCSVCCVLQSSTVQCQCGTSEGEGKAWPIEMNYDGENVELKTSTFITNQMYEQ